MSDMNALIWATLRGENSIHVGVPGISIPAIEHQARTQGFHYHFVAFPASISLEGFYDVLDNEFDFPTKPVNMPGLLDWLGSLEWIENDVGHVLVFDGLNQLLSSCFGAFRGLADLLPFSADRQRSAGRSFHVFLIGTEPDVVNKALFDIEDANSALEEDNSSVNPSAPVKVLNHSAISTD